jgi:transposase-like protein
MESPEIPGRFTNTLERLNKEVKRRASEMGLFPNEASIRRLIGGVLMEQHEEWQLQHRYLPQHAMADTPVAGGVDLTPRCLNNDS